MKKEINRCIDTQMPIDIHIKGNTYIYRNVYMQYTNIHTYTRKYIHAKSNEREEIHTCNTLLYIPKKG